MWPGPTLLTLIYLFGAYVLVDGIFAVISGIRSYGESERWWAALLEGLLGIAVGVLTFIWPITTGLVLLYFIAAWAIISGIFEIIAAIQLRRVITGEWLMVLSGLASIVFGVLLVIFPSGGALALTWLIGIYAILFGILFIILAFRLRGMRADTTTPIDDAPAGRTAL
jgi:uncharacterized membrane protein HdeD (DUF308 family)